MPTLRPFRALRYDPVIAGELDRLICPPYDVIDPQRRETLAGRDPHNAVQLELPAVEPGDDDHERYRRAARLLASWRTEGILRKDPRHSIYLYQQTHRVPAHDGDGATRSQVGVLCRLKLEDPVPGSGVLRHERTLDAPKEDRYRLLRATGLNTSPVVGIHRSDGSAGRLVAELATGAPDAEATDDDGVRHRLWAVPAGEPGGDDRTEALLGAIAGPIVIADGHHRYETAIRFRDERERACESDPPFDYVLALLFDITTEPLTVLATHRLLRQGPAGGSLIAALAGLFETDPVGSAEELIATMERPAPIDAAGAGTGRFAVWSDGQGAVLRVRPDAFAPLVASLAPALRGVDTARLAAALERVAGMDATVSRSTERLGYTKDPREAIAAVTTGEAAACFLLDPTPVDAVMAVAQAGEVMPQKSTYFYPKAATGLVFNPHES